MLWPRQGPGNLPTFSKQYPTPGEPPALPNETPSMGMFLLMWASKTGIELSRALLRGSRPTNLLNRYSLLDVSLKLSCFSVTFVIRYSLFSAINASMCPAISSGSSRCAPSPKAPATRAPLLKPNKCLISKTPSQRGSTLPSASKSKTE